MSDGFAPLILTKLSIRKMAGLESGLTLKDLSPGVNVIHGPNGVGKSRTALALNLALWPNALEQAGGNAVAAWFELGNDAWAVEVDSENARHQRGGVDADPPFLPGIENRDRYNLALQELLADRGANFARAIQRESAGGYDLSAAAGALGIDKKPAARYTRETEALVLAGRVVGERKNKLDALRRSEQELGELIRERDAARGDSARVPRLEAALALADAIRNKESAEERLNSFPPAVAKLSGTELEQLQQLRRDIQEKQQIAEDARLELKRTEAALAATRLPAGAADETVISALADFSRQLAEMRNRIAAHEQDVHAAKARRQRGSESIGSAVSDEKLARLDLKGINDLAAFAREAEKSRGNLIAVESVRRWLSAALPASPDGAEKDRSADAEAAEAGRLEQGLRLLAQWLRQPGELAPTADDNSKAIILVAAGLIVVLALLLAWQWHSSAALLALAGPLLYFVWMKARRTPKIAGDARPIFQQQYAALRLDMPSQWAADAVEELSRQLWDRLAAATLRRERAERLAGQGPLIAAAEAQCKSIAQRREELAGRFGLAPAVDESVLHAFVDGVLRWQQADGDLAGAAAKLAATRDQQRQTFTAAGDLLRRFGYDTSDPAEIDAARENLRRRFEEHRAAALLIERLNQQLQDVHRQGGELAARAQAIFAASGLPADDEATLQRWLEMRGDYGAAKTAFDIASNREQELAGNLLQEPTLIQRPTAELESALASCREQAGRVGPLSDQIAGIRREIEMAQHAADLEEAQAQQRESAAALAASRAEDCESAAGWVLLEHLRGASRRRHQSAVFRRAREIFARVTRGRYRLEFDDSAKIPEFRCIDSITGFGQSLDELSSGTRLQLLLAVRVAFVEQQEQGPRLPLILDETLANSDETRARQILDSLIEICRGGRQVFYFTAQPDEVGKWDEVLKAQQGPDAVPYRLIDLAAERGLAEAERTPPRQIVTAPATLVPPPGNLTREEYARLLEVPGIDPHWPTAGAVHLWHIVENLSTLHQLLAMGIRTWGQWKTMAEIGGLGIADAQEEYERAEARARLIESLTRFWKIGRGQPVDRAAIIQSDAITPRYLDDVSALATTESGDARRLIARLEEKAIPGFRSNITDRFKAWLQDNGYLDVREPLSSDEMRLRAIAAAEKDLQVGKITARQIDEYLTTWFTPHAIVAAE